MQEAFENDDLINAQVEQPEITNLQEHPSSVQNYKDQYASTAFNYKDEQMSDSDCSEDYDSDPFFQQSGRAYLQAIKDACAEENKGNNDANNPEEEDDDEDVQDSEVYIEDLTKKRQQTVDFVITQQKETTYNDFMEHQIE